MRRSVLGWVYVFALCEVPLLGCSETAGGGGPECQGPADCGDGNECSADLCTNGACEATAVVDGTACTDGACLDGVCAPIGAFPCTEQGIIDAIAEGGGPHFFACDGPQTVVTEAQIEIYNDVVLDGENDLTVDGNDDHGVIAVAESITAELRGFTVTGGNAGQPAGAALSKAGGIHSFAVTSGGIYNSGVLTLTNCRVVGNRGQAGGGILNTGSGSTLTLVNSTVENNAARFVGGGISNSGRLMLVRSAVLNNESEGYGGGIANFVDPGTWSQQAIGTIANSTVAGNTAADFGGGIEDLEVPGLRLINSTVSRNTAPFGSAIYGRLSVTGSVISGDCDGDVASTGYNIESPGDTCGFYQPTDQANVSADDLNIGPLQDNGGPTMTHALLPGSAAIDVIPEADCVDAGGMPLTTDQRGQPRPEMGGTMCDVGAFEVQP